MKEFITAVEDDAAEQDAEERYVEFSVDGRVLRAYQPNEGQLAFMLASLGRGQNTQSRFASIVNIMMESLRGDDKDYLEGRLLSGDPKDRMKIETIEQIFGFLVEEWYARPTKSPSDSAPSQQKDGQKSKPRTTKSAS